MVTAVASSADAIYETTETNLPSVPVRKQSLANNASSARRRGSAAVTNRKKSIASNGSGKALTSRKSSVDSSATEASVATVVEPQQTRVVLSVDRKRSTPHVEKLANNTTQPNTADNSCFDL